MKPTAILIISMLVLATAIIYAGITEEDATNKTRTAVNSEGINERSSTVRNTSQDIRQLIMKDRGVFIERLLRNKVFQSFISKNWISPDVIRNSSIYVRSVVEENGIYRVKVEIILSLIDAIVVTAHVDENLNIIDIVKPIEFDVPTSPEAKEFFQKGVWFIHSRDKVSILLRDENVSRTLGEYGINYSEALEYIVGNEHILDYVGNDSHAYYMIILTYFNITLNNKTMLIPGNKLNLSRFNPNSTEKCNGEISIHIMFSLDRDLSPTVYKIYVMKIPGCATTHPMIINRNSNRR